MSNLAQKRLLQAAVAIACLVPIAAGIGGIFDGVRMLGPGDVTLDSHFRYLSGLLLGLGIGFLSIIPNIENQRERATLLSSIVVLGGFARLYGVWVEGWPAPPMLFALLMELGVVPLLWLWQRQLR